MDKNKKSYIKPRLRVIKLTSDEVLAIGCWKVDSAPAEGGLPNVCSFGDCRDSLNPS